MGAYGLPSGACQPCPPIGGCSATDLCHNLLWTGLAVPISSKGGALDVPHLDVRIGYGRARIPAVAGVFELTADAASHLKPIGVPSTPRQLPACGAENQVPDSHQLSAIT